MLPAAFSAARGTTVLIAFGNFEPPFLLSGSPYLVGLAVATDKRAVDIEACCSKLREGPVRTKDRVANRNRLVRETLHGLHELSLGTLCLDLVAPLPIALHLSWGLTPELSGSRPPAVG